MKTKGKPVWGLLGPYTLWAAVFIVVPLVFVAYYAFTDNSFTFTFDNLIRFFNDRSQMGDIEVRTYMLIFWRSLKLAVISTVICLLLGYPLAYIMSRASDRSQKIMMTLLMIPMWM
ncbi:MAG: ABC transporter permease, partial [Oscillospiraceae bacterium]|nr:ABC transporter permease [Oscillospiraceae bacterium]